jgi:hypothetical protein
MIQVVVLEGAIVLLVKANQNRHDFAQAQAAITVALLQTTAEQLPLPDRFKALAEVIDGAEQFF